MSKSERPTAALRRLLADPKLTQIPGVVDAAWAPRRRCGGV